MRGRRGGRALRHAGEPEPADPAGGHRAHRHRRRDGRRAAPTSRTPWRASSRSPARTCWWPTTRPSTCASSTTSAAAWRAATSPSPGSTPWCSPAGCSTGRSSATTCARSPAGPTPRSSRSTAPCPTPRPRPRCCRAARSCSPSAAWTRSSGPSPSRGTGGARHAYKLALAEELPALPGVYVMRDRRGRALYVGKAADLRRRVRSYFGPGGRHGRLIGRALEQLDSIDHEVCGSEFAALLRENDLIKQLNPPCNRRGAGAGGRFLKISWGEMAPRLYVVSRVLADGASYFGPIRSERLAREAVERLHAMYPLAAQDPEARDEALAEVEELLAGRRRRHRPAGPAHRPGRRRRAPGLRPERGRRPGRVRAGRARRPRPRPARAAAGGRHRRAAPRRPRRGVLRRRRHRAQPRRHRARRLARRRPRRPRRAPPRRAAGPRRSRRTRSTRSRSWRGGCSTGRRRDRRCACRRAGARPRRWRGSRARSPGSARRRRRPGADRLRA